MWRAAVKFGISGALWAEGRRLRHCTDVGIGSTEVCRGLVLIDRAPWSTCQWMGRTRSDIVRTYELLRRPAGCYVGNGDV